MIDPAQFKDLFLALLEDYPEVKKEAVELGYDEELFKFKDYLEWYLRLKE